MTQKIEPSKSNSYEAASNALSNTKWQQSIKPETKKVAFADLSKKLSDAEKVESITKDTVAKYWPILIKKFPKAFESKGFLKKTIPDIIYINSPKKLYEIYPEAKGKEPIAFVYPNSPNKIYFYMPQAIVSLKQDGDAEIKRITTHEMVHSVTSGVSMRIDKDKRYSDTYNNVFKEINQTITLPPLTREGEKLTFTVAELLIEGVAERESIHTTGIESKNTNYQPYREITAKSISRVTRNTYEKAMFENDAKSYETVVKAAVILKQEYDAAHKEALENPAKYWIKTNLEKIGF
jgi:hypothetical protein